MKRIAVADEQPLTRLSIRGMLEAEGHQVVGEFGDGRQALSYALEHRPDLLILELALPHLGGLEVIQRLHQANSPVRTLVLTAQNTKHFAGLSLQAGSSGFLGKQESLDELREAVSNILRGHSYFPTQSLDGAPASDEIAQLQSLSPRETTVLHYLASGLSNKQIANELAVSSSTVSTYKTRLLEKLNVSSLAELLELVWRNQLLGQLPSPRLLQQIDPEQSLNEQFHARFDDLQLAIALRDEDGHLLAGNQAFFTFHGVNEADQLGRRIIDSITLEPEQALQLYQEFRTAYTEGQSYSLHVMVNRGPRLRILRHWGAPYHDDDGKMLGMICATVDITESEQQMLVLKESTRKLEALRQRHRQFLVGVGQQGVIALDAVTRDLREAARQAPDIPALHQAQQTVAELREDLDALLELGRLENNERLLAPTPAMLERLTEEACRDFAGRHRIPCPILDGATLATSAWIDPACYQRILRTLLRHGLRRGAQALQLRTRVQHLANAELEWQVELHTAEPLAPSAAPTSLISPEDALCQRLASHMGGSLVLPANGQPLGRLTLRLDQSSTE